MADIVNSTSNGVVTVSIISINNKAVSGISTNGCKNSVSKAGTQGQTNTSTCECFSITNSTSSTVPITFTPCGASETTVNLLAGLTLRDCYEIGTIIYHPGLPPATICNTSCTAEGNCSTCS